jgi:DNA-binding PadR family transcriptional regulator
MRRIGVDLHKTNFVACFLDEPGEPTVKTFALTEQGLRTFQREITRTDEVAVEAPANAYYFYERVVKLARRGSC